MASLGELFVELGVVGDIEPLQKAITKTKQLVSQIDKEIESNKRLAKYLEDLSKARTNSEKKIIKENFANEVQKSKLNEQSKATQNLLNKKKEQLALITKGVAGFVAFATAIGGAIVAINKLTDSLIQSNQAWVNFTNQTDLALSSLQEYAGVAGLLDKSLGAQGAAGTIQNLNDKLFELQLTGEGARGFMLGGINPMGQDAFGVIEQLRDRVKSLDNTSATYLLKQMGLDPKLLPMLRMTREEFEQLAEVQRKYSLNEEQRAQIQKMNIQLGIAQQKLQYLKDKAILAIMPYWIRFMKAVADIAEMFAKVGVSIGRFVKKWGSLASVLLLTISRIHRVRRAVLRLTIPFLRMSQTFRTLISQIPRFGRAIVGLGGIFARAFLPLTAAFLILEDLATYFNGGDSLTGRVLNSLNSYKDDFKNAFNLFGQGDIKGGAVTVTDTLLNAILDIQNILIRILEMITNFLTFGALDKVKNSKFGKYLFADVEDAIKIINKNNGQTTGEAAPIGYVGELPNITGGVQNTINNNRTAMNTANTSNNVTQNIQIQTNQPAESVKNELAHANYVFT